MFRFAIISLGLILAVSGCSTQAQQQYKASATAYHIATTERNECFSSAAQNTAYAGLAQHMPLQPGANPSLEQLAASELPSPDDINQLTAWHRDVEQCRQQFMAAAQQSFRFLVGTLEENAADSDAFLLRLVRKEIAWGPANIQLSQTRLAAQARISRVVANWTGELKEEHREEMAQRARAGAAFSRAMSNLGNHATPVVVSAYQPVPPAIHTSCMTISGITNCTTQ